MFFIPLFNGIVTNNKALFGDIDFNSLDGEKHARFIIERLLQKGDISDWKLIKLYFGLDKIKSDVVRVRHFNDKTLNFLSVILNIPKEEFRCYNTKVSTQKHWT